MTLDQNKLDELRRLAMATTCAVRDSWYVAEDFRQFGFTDEDFIAYFAATRPKTIFALLDLAQKALVPMNLREAPHCSSCSCGETAPPVDGAA